MRNLLGVLFALMLFMGVLTACGPANDTDVGANDDAGGNQAQDTKKPKKLIVWEDQDKGPALEDAAAKFEKEYGIKIEYEEYNITDIEDNLALDGNTDNAPDVVTLPHDHVGTAVVKGYISPLKESDDVLGQYTDSSVQALKYDGKLYGLPKAVETPVYIYNKDLLKEVPDSMDKVYELSKKAVQDGSYGFLAIWDDFYHAYGVFHGFGGYVFKDGIEPSDIGLNNDGSIDALKYIQKWYKEGLFPSGIIGEKSNDAMNGLFKDGKAFAVQNGPWAFKDYRDAGINIGIAPMPKLPNGNPVGTFLGVKGWFVTTFSKNQIWAQKFVEFITNEDNAKTRFELTGEIPPLASLLDDDEWVSENEGAAAVMAQSKNAIPMPSIPEMSEIWDPMAAAIQSVATGKKEPEKALDVSVKLIKQNIKMNHDDDAS